MCKLRVANQFFRIHSAIIWEFTLPKLPKICNSALCNTAIKCCFFFVVFFFSKKLSRRSRSDLQDGSRSLELFSRSLGLFSRSLGLFWKEKNRICNRSLMQTEKSQPEGKRIMRNNNGIIRCREG